MKLIVTFSAIVAVISCLAFTGGGGVKEFDPVQSHEDSLAQDRAFYVQQIQDAIKGKEDLPVDSVFKNLKYIGGFKAGMLPRIMGKWSEAIGVSCNHCHVTGKWALDDKPAKNIARQMAELSSKINKDLVKIEGLEDRKPVVNCTTCHRGQLKPAFNLEQK
jgi:hypothetical protein